MEVRHAHSSCRLRFRREKGATIMSIQREKQQSRGTSSSKHTSSVRAIQFNGTDLNSGAARKGLEELFSSYKVTALQDVTIRACVREQPEWVNLHAGEVRHGVKTCLLYTSDAADE